MTETPETPIYHVGILVEHLEAAMERFSTVLGLSFGEPRKLDLRGVIDGDLPSDRTLRVVHSIEGPPFVELIEAQESGVWGIDQGEGLHHIGCWQPGFADRIENLDDENLEVEATVPMEGELIAAYLRPAMAHNTRIEFVCPLDERGNP